MGLIARWSELACGALSQGSPSRVIMGMTPTEWARFAGHRGLGRRFVGRSNSLSIPGPGIWRGPPASASAGSGGTRAARHGPGPRWRCLRSPWH